MVLMKLVDKWISDLVDRAKPHYWCCRHRWCYRPCTYQYRCHLHQDDE